MAVSLLYTATTWAGYIGILTAQRPGAYAAAVNFREPGGERAAVAENALPVGLALRLALERNEGYGDFCGGPREAQNGWLKVGKFLGAPLVLNSLTIIIHSSYNSDLVRF